MKMKNKTELPKHLLPPNEPIYLYEYQKRELDKIQRQYSDSLFTYADVVGHLLNVFKVTQQFYHRFNEEE